MNAQDLIDTARTLVAGDKGLLAMDESNPTCNTRFAKLGIPQTEEARRAYRELIVTTPGLAESISGAILYDETIRQQNKDGTPFVKVLTDAGIIPGIKVDTGATDMAGDPREKITEGLDGLRNRLAEYSYMGAQLAKRRALIAVGDGIPSRGYLEANAHALARYAGASGIDLPQASSGGRGCRRHGEVSLASRPRGRSGDLHSCRAADPIELASARFEYLECSVKAANGFRRWRLRLLAPAATGFEDLAGPAGGGTEKLCIIEPGTTGLRAASNTYTAMERDASVTTRIAQLRKPEA